MDKAGTILGDSSILDLLEKTINIRNQLDEIQKRFDKPENTDDLRDRIAIAALQGLLAHGHKPQTQLNGIYITQSLIDYSYADAMLLARKQERK